MNIKIYPLLAVFVLIFSIAKANLYINEIVTSNSSIIADEDGDFSDWIEIFNSGPSSVNLEGYGLSDSYTSPFKWTFPAVTLESGEFLLVWASGKNRKVSDGELHTSFSLSASGEEVVLTHPDGTKLDEIPPTVMPGEISYGRTTDGSVGFSFFQMPTPGFSNSSSTPFLGYLNPPRFSIEGGYFFDSLELTIISDHPGAVIVYTIDGSLPDTNLIGGKTYNYKKQYPENVLQPLGPLLQDTIYAFKYEEPIFFGNPNLKPNKLSLKKTTATNGLNAIYYPITNVRKVHVVKARVFAEGYIPSKVVSHTFIYSEDGNPIHTLPIISLTTQEDNLFSYEKGIFVAGEDYDKWRFDNPLAARNCNSEYNWNRTTEFDASFEFFDGTNKELEINCGLRIHGNCTKSYPRKASRLYFRGEYGSSTLNHPIFPNSQPKETQHKRIVFRNAGNDDDVARMRDMVAQQVVRHLPFESQDSRPAVMYLNGEYNGVFNIRERIDRHYLERKYGIAQNELNLLRDLARVEEGSNVHYNQMMVYLRQTPTVTDARMNYVRTQMDVENWADYYLTEIYFNNFDWPRTNVMFYRKNTNEYLPDAPYPHDGRWRWVIFDLDVTMGLNSPSSFNSVSNAFRLGENSTELGARLITNINFRNYFINRFADLINTTFLQERTDSILSYYENLLTPEMQEHGERWRNRPGDLNVWKGRVSEIRNFLNQRNTFIREHIRTAFALTAQREITIDVSDDEHGYVKINTITIDTNTVGIKPNPYPWSGIYFQSVPVTLRAIPFEGYRFSHWEGDVSSNLKELTLNLTSNTQIKAVFIESPCKDALDILHYWHFNELPGVTLSAVNADTGTLTGGVIRYQGSGAGFMDRVSPGTDINRLFGKVAGSALRVRNPSNTRDLIIEAPSTNYGNLVFQYAVSRTNNGALQKQIFYTTTPDKSTWKPLSSEVSVSEDFFLVEFDLTNIPETFNSPNLAFKISFLGENAAGASGNNRFDNIVLRGRELTTEEVTVEFGVTYPFGDNTLSESGLYAHTFLDIDECDSLVLLKLTVLPPPCGLPEKFRVVQEGESLKLNNSSLSQIKWYKNDILIPGATSITYTPTEIGSYYATGVGEYDCLYYTDTLNLLALNTMLEDFNRHFNVHPNPFSQNLIIQSYDSGDFVISITNAAGQQITRLNNGKKSILEISTKDWSAGSYYIMITKGKNVYSKKLVKLK